MLNTSEYIHFEARMTLINNSDSQAERHSDKTVQRFSKDRWLDMGMATVVFTVHTDHHGCLVADV